MVGSTIGLYYNGARYLAAWLGRWTSADPIGIGADGPGLYNYTRGSPVNYTDPSGNDAVGQGIADALEWASNEVDRINYEAGAQTIDTGPPAISAQEPGNQGFETAMYTGGELAREAQVSKWLEEQDYEARDAQGRRVWEQGTDGGWALAQRIELPVGTEDAELWLYTAGIASVAGTGLRGSVALADDLATGFGARTAVDDAFAGITDEVAVRGPGGGRVTIFSPPRAGQVQEGLGGQSGPMWEGHGGTVDLGLPPRITPENTYIRYPLMENLDEQIAQSVARTGRIPEGTPFGTVGPGDPLPELVLLPRTGGMIIHPDSTVARSPTLLRDLVEPNMGLCTWNACTVPIDPARIRFNPGRK